jgi:uncharacterized protein (TIGR03437 family)
MIARLAPLLVASPGRRAVLLLLGLTLSVTLVSTERHALSRTTTLANAPVWYRGNTHTHTTNSDGDSSPMAVASWYKDAGYNFLFITDHNKLTEIDTLNAQLGVPGQYVVMPGEEVTDIFNGKPVHVNGLNNLLPVLPQHGTNVVNTMENDLAALRQAGGLSYINHPNFGWALTADDLKNVAGSMLFEVYNAHPLVNESGDATHPSVEAMWDTVLSRGHLLYGIAADDEHTLNKGAGAYPGRAWIMVRAASLDAAAITQAIERGDFYASTGVTLQDYQVSATSMSVAVDNSAGATTTIDFIGRNGQLLQRNTTLTAVYNFTGQQMYVRAKLTNDLGQSAWTQPVFTERLNHNDAILNGASLGHEPANARALAPGSIAIASGLGLAQSTLQAQRQPDGSFPTSLANTSVTVNGRAAAVHYVSSTQVNFVVPAETEPGTADVVVTNADGLQMHSAIKVTTAAPGIFTIDGTGRGNAFTLDVSTLLCRHFVPDDGARRFIIYATGVSGATQVAVTLNGQPVVVEAIKPSLALPGLDQVRIAIPALISLPATATMVIKADGVESNPAMLQL